jgi:hypothetical protein
MCIYIDLSKAINGDSRTEPQSLFTVRILLENNNRVTYMPSMVNLTHSVNVVAKDIISVVAAFPRIRNQNFDDDIKTIGTGSRSSFSDKGIKIRCTHESQYAYSRRINHCL